MPAKIVDFQQNSADWLEWRRHHIGGSDAPIILHVSPFKSCYSLWQEKIGRRKVEESEDEFTPFGSKKATKHGKDMEAEARDAFTAETGLFLPSACIENTTEDGIPMSTSLDGYDPVAKVALEIKCPKTPYDFIQIREGSVPEHYYPQLMHNWTVAEVEVFFLWAYFGGKGALLEFKRERHYDRAWVADVLIAEERRFWKWVQDRQFPIPVQKEASLDGDKGAVADAQELRSLLEQRKRLERDILRYEGALKRRVTPLRAKKVLVGDMQISMTTRAGAVRWKQLLADRGIAGYDEDAYRNPESLIYEFSQVKA